MLYIHTNRLTMTRSLVRLVGKRSDDNYVEVQPVYDDGEPLEFRQPFVTLASTLAATF